MPKIGDRIKELNGKPFYSFEYFPPKTPAGVANLYERVERMGKLEPLFVDITWGAGGSTTDLTLELSSNFQQQFCLETQMHLTCTNIEKDSVTAALKTAKENGIRNILCLRGDPPHGQEKWEVTEGGFANAVDLVKYIRQTHGDTFGIAVAGYPEGHIDHFKDLPEITPEAYKKDLQYLKDKVDAGADCIITQLFYDMDIYEQWVKDCREIGINVPIIPGIMPINTYAGFFRMTGFCKTKVPQHIKDSLEAIKDNDEAVKKYGVEVVSEMCKRLIAGGAPGLHMYTLNLEKSVLEILTNLGMLKDSSERRQLPWRPRISSKPEDVRPIFWANRPRSYMSRTAAWDDFPNGRWGDSRSPAYGELSDYHLTELHSVDEADRKSAYGIELAGAATINELFAKFINGEIKRLPWCAHLEEETQVIKTPLAAVCGNGFLTINSQPAINGVSSDHAIYGWGGPGGLVYQKGYAEFFCSPAHLAALKSVLPAHMEYSAVNCKGQFETSAKSKVVAVTWGVFPDQEIKQPTVVDQDSFMVWKDEAFALWLKQWKSLYEEGSASAKLIQEVHDTYHLVTVVDNNFVTGEGELLRVFDLASAKIGKTGSVASG